MKIDNRLKKTMIISIAVIFLIFIIVIIIGSIANRKLSYQKIENKMKDAAVEYYNAHSKLLPQVEEGEVKVDVDTLVKGEYIKPLKKYVNKNESCDGEVYVTLRDGSYIYTPYLVCDNYTTKTLYNYITENEVVIEDKNSGEDGLYNYNGTLIYRGEDINNYVTFAGQVWRILRIDSDHNIRLFQTEPVERMVWDNRYNVETKDNSGYSNFEKSRLSDAFAGIYEGQYGEIFSATDKQKMVKKHLCLDSKNEYSFAQNGVIECNTQSTEKYPFALLDISEYFIASLDQNCNSFNNYSCANYNYMNSYGSYWSMNTYAGNSYQAYYISNGAQLENVNKREDVRLVITLSKNVLYSSGDGSLSNPYIVG